MRGHLQVCSLSACALTGQQDAQLFAGAAAHRDADTADEQAGFWRSHHGLVLP